MGFGRTYRAHAFVLVVCLTLVGCKEPMSVERFVKGEGPYSFFMDLSDTTATYDLDFYTRVDAPRDSLDKVGALPLSVTWTSPSFHVFREEVYLPLEGTSTYYSRQVRMPYRAGVQPDEAGTWTLTVRVSDPPEGLCGMGLVVQKKR